MSQEADSYRLTSLDMLTHHLTHPFLLNAPAYTIQRLIVAYCVLHKMQVPTTSSGRHFWIVDLLSRIPPNQLMDDKFLQILGEGFTEDQPHHDLQMTERYLDPRDPQLEIKRKVVGSWLEASRLRRMGLPSGSPGEDIDVHELTLLLDKLNLTKEMALDNFFGGLREKTDRQKLFLDFNFCVCLREACRSVAIAITQQGKNASWGLGESTPSGAFKIPREETFRSIITSVAVRIEKDQDIPFEVVDGIAGSLGTLARLNLQFSDALDNLRKQFVKLSKDPEEIKGFQDLSAKIGIDLPDDLNGLAALVSRSRRLRDYPR